MTDLATDPRLQELYQQSNTPLGSAGGDYDDTDLSGIDGKDVDLDRFGGELIPDGTWAPFVITKAKAGKTNGGKNKMDLDMQVSDGPYKGRHIWPLIMLEGDGKANLFALARAFDWYDQAAGRVTCKVGDFVGKKLWARIDIEPAKDFMKDGETKKGQDRNKIGYCQFAKYESRTIESVGVTAKPLPAAPGAQPQPAVQAAPQPTPVTQAPAPVAQPPAPAPVPAPVAAPTPAPVAQQAAAPAPPAASIPTTPPSVAPATAITASWAEVPTEE